MAPTLIPESFSNKRGKTWKKTSSIRAFGQLFAVILLLQSGDFLLTFRDPASEVAIRRFKSALRPVIEWRLVWLIDERADSRTAGQQDNAGMRLVAAPLWFRRSCTVADAETCWNLKNPLSIRPAYWLNCLCLVLAAALIDFLRRKWNGCVSGLAHVAIASIASTPSINRVIQNLASTLFAYFWKLRYLQN